MTLIFPDDTSEKNLLNHAKDAQVIVGWKPTEQLLDAAKQLKLFINPGAGVQRIVSLFEDRPEIVLVNGHGNAFFTAEHILAMLLSLTNRILPHDQWMREGHWRLGDKEAKSISLKYRTVGLLGYGHVNQLVHQLLIPFGCDINILKRIPENDQFGPEQLYDFLKMIDVLIITIPLTKHTKNLIRKVELELLGKDALMINASRGDIIVEEDLYNALKDRTIESAAIDVWYNYKVEPDEQGKKYPYQYPFHELDNILLSPHRAASPMDNLDRWDDVIENIKRVSQGRTDFLNVVDIEAEY